MIVFFKSNTNKIIAVQFNGKLNEKDLAAILEGLNDISLGKKPLVVKQAEEKPGGGGGGYRGGGGNRGGGGGGYNNGYGNNRDRNR